MLNKTSMMQDRQFSDFRSNQRIQ